MHRFVLFLRPSKAAWIVLLMIAVFVATGRSVAPPQVLKITLHGIVRDAGGKPVAGVSVCARSGEQTEIAKTVTDEKGAYRFSGLEPGVYILQATKQGYSSGNAGPVSVGSGEVKGVDLAVLEIPASAGFYDQPQFTVSGVTDTTALGGHGSDTVVHTRDALAKETVGLAKGAATVSAGSLTPTEQLLRQAAEQDPTNFDANLKLAEFLVGNGRAGESFPYLERAVKLRPDDYFAQFELALANVNAGNYERGRQEAQRLLQSHETGELHHLLADVDENLGDPLGAVHHYERAAELSPSEPYVFDWGAELLLHHAPEPALNVFSRGNKLFPESVRMLIGIGASSFALGNYDQAVENICRASDVAPSHPAPYVFLGKMDRVASITSNALLERLRRFAEVSPQNAQANYLYAAALWKRRQDKGSGDNGNGAEKVESLLKIAIRLDPKFADAYVQLGVLHSEQRKFRDAIGDYQHAIEFDPEQQEAHYRLAQAYRRSGEPEKAKNETAIYEQLAKDSALKANRERHEIRQFVYTLKDAQTSHQ